MKDSHRSNSRSNFVYSALYQLANLLFPLLTIPYLARELGVEGIGIYAFTYAAAYYFVMLSMLGIENYGVRYISSIRDSKENLSKAFSSIYIVHAAVTLCSVIAYMLFVSYAIDDYKNIFYIHSIFILASLININWFFMGIEKFKLIFIRDIILKFISLVLILMLVRGDHSLEIYALIMSLGALVSQLALWTNLKKYIYFSKVSLAECVRHVRPLFILFIPVIAVIIYQTIGKLALGLLTDIEQVGLFENALRIVMLPFGIIAALGIVMLPKISNIVAKRNEKQMEHYIGKSIKFSMFMAAPIAFGILATSSSIVPILLGDQFLGSIQLIAIMAPLVLFAAWANVLRTQYLLPKNKDKLYITSVLIGAVINIVLNLILIPIWQAAGAAISTILTEFAVMAYQTYAVRKDLDIKRYSLSILPSLLKGSVMFGVVLLVGLLDIDIFAKLSLQIIIGSVTYALLSFGYIRALPPNRLLK